MGIDIALYLMREGTAIHQVLPQEKIDSGEYEQVAMRDNAAFEEDNLCFVRRSQPSQAGWVGWLEEVFDFEDSPPQTQSSGCILVLEAAERVFALAFGLGRHGIDPTCLEYDFGLRVALNKVQPDQLRQLVSKTVDLRTREKSTYHHAGGPIGEFAMDLNMDWLRSIAGAADPAENFSAVAGTDAIRLRNYTRPLSELPTLCADLLTAYGADPPELFSFVEHVRPISQRQSLHQELENLFLDALVSGERDALEVIADWTVADRMATGRLYFGNQSEPIEDLSATAVLGGIDNLISNGEITTPATIKLEVLAEDGSLVCKISALDIVQAQLVHNGNTYLRLERRWFAVAHDYIQEVNRRIKALPTATERLDLPAWDKAQHAEESHYNQHVAQQKHWLLQDEKFLYPGGGAKVEPCDLLTESGDFIHVKDGASSAALNHLFGQLSASAELYAHDGGARKTMRQRYGKQWKKKPLAERRPCFVAAVGRRKVTNDLLGRMLVAKINLLDHVRRIKALEFDFALAGFEVTT